MTRLLRRWWTVVAVMIFCVGAGRAEGVPAPSPTASLVASPQVLPDLDQRLKKVQAALGSMKQAGEANRTLEDLLARRAQILLEIRSEQARLANLKNAPMMPPSEGGGPSGSLSALDALDQRIAGLKVAINVGTTMLGTNRQALEDAQRKYHEVQSQFAQLQDQPSGSVPSQGMNVAEQNVRLAEEKVALLSLRVDYQVHRIEIEKQWQKTLEKLRDKAEKAFHGKREELNAILTRLTQREVRWNQRLEQAKVRAASAQTALANLERRAVISVRSEVDKERLQALEAEAEAWNLEQEVVSGELDRIGRLRKLWKRRWAALTKKASRQQMRQWLGETKQQKASREAEQRLVQAKLLQLQQQQKTIDAELKAARKKRWLRVQREWNRRMIVTQQDQLNGIQEELALLDTFSAELLRKVGTPTPIEQLRKARKQIKGVWDFVITQVGGRTITTGKLVTALLYLLLGGWLVNRLVRVGAPPFLRRFNVEPGAAAALEALTRYALLVLVAAFALWSSGIPLTIFTFAGGALAIGVGFGSQNILNNFISGLILLIERPIKVGDLVEVEGALGSVEGVGARSTRIRTVDNAHLVVPNSQLLEHSVTNWTLSDHVVRIKLLVGVAYGSPVRQVEELMLQVMRNHPKVLKRPEPTVFFDDFGASALSFEGLCWISVRSIFDRKRVLSDLRFQLNDVLNGEGIVIAFPQNDVHLDVAHPIEVHIDGKPTVEGDCDGNVRGEG